jgi:cathepsin L
LIAAFGIIAANENPLVKNILENFMEKTPKELFKVWHFLYEKKYTLDTQEARQRFANFKENLKIIREHNASESSYKLGLNKFSDMTIAEFKAKYATKKIVKGEELDRMMKKLNMIPAANFLEDDDDDLTKRNLAAKVAIDYRQFFPAIRDQGDCGSCWAFSTAAALEGAYGFKNKKAPVSFSTQQLVDCDDNNNGCDGGNFNPSFTYAQNNGLQSDTSYPYQAVQQDCNYNSSKVAAKPKSFSYCSNYSSNTKVNCSIDIVYGLLTTGPCSVGIDAGTSAFQSYQSGIYTAACSEDNHAVVLVGYGVDAKTRAEYWIVRNSWSSDWGNKGYITVAINDNNSHSCFVNNEAYQFKF